MLSIIIDAKEGRRVATTDIPGAFLQTSMPEGTAKVHIHLNRPLAEQLAKLDPKLYREHIIMNRKGKPVLFGEAQKAIYGTLNASLLFWNKLVKSLTSWGFELNPYDWCCANKMIACHRSYGPDTFSRHRVL